MPQYLDVQGAENDHFPSSIFEFIPLFLKSFIQDIQHKPIIFKP